MINHNKPCVYKKDAKTVSKTILSGWLAYGKKSTLLEKKLSSLVLNKKKKNRAVVCTNGTTALYLALYALNIKKGDEVILPTYTCTAVINAVTQINAKPILVDIEDKSLGLDYTCVKKSISKKTKAIIIIHTYGIACEIDKFKKFNIPIIEDCSQSLGTTFNDGTQTGSKGDISVFSFYATKMVTGGYGGAIVSKNKLLISKIKNYINFDQPKNYFPRFNFLLSDINSSLILSGLNRLTDTLNKKRYIASKYTDILSEKLLKYAIVKGQNYYRFILYFNNKNDLLKIYNKLKDNHIGAIIPLKTNELLHHYIKQNKQNFTTSELLAKQLLSIPIYPCLKKKDIKKIITILKEIK